MIAPLRFCRVSTLAVLALAVVLPIACSSPIAPQPIATSADTGDAVDSGFYDGGFEHQGKHRSFTVYIPPGYGGDAMPLIVALHGGLGTGKQFERHSRLSRPASTRRFIVVYPDGLGRTWNAGSCCGGAARDNVDDVGFIAELIARLAERYRIDTRRVYGTGFSNGAMMVHRIACDRPDLFAGIAPVAGGPMLDPCTGADTPIPTLLIQGTQDPRIPWDGGVVNNSAREPFPQVVDAMARRNGCDAGRGEIATHGDTTCWQREGCPIDAPVEYCVVRGGGHQWPGGKTLMPMLLGRNARGFDASQQILAFFSGLDLRRETGSESHERLAR